MLGKLIGGLLRRGEATPGGAALGTVEMERFKTALDYAGQGRLAEAERLYRELLAAHPEHVDLMHLTGNAALARGDLPDAIELLTRATRLEPASAELNLHLGDALAAGGATLRAIEHYRRALAANPDFVPAHLQLGRALQQSGDVDAAAQTYRHALELCPDGAEIYVALATVLRQLGDCKEALETCECALALKPDSPDANLQRGHALRDLGRVEESIGAYRRAAQLRPDVPDAHLHLGNALYLESRDLEAAAGEYRRVLELDPGASEARFNLALMRLASGDYANGWPDYELRRLDPAWRQRPVEYPQWTGGEVAGKRLLVYSEQGLGDEIMFASCIPDVVSLGAHCIIECLPKLETLFRRSFPSATVYPRNAERTLPAAIVEAGIDLETPIGSLPRHFRRTPEAFPRHSGYLSADSRKMAGWRDRLAVLGEGLKVGIAWQGGTQKSRRMSRSLSLAHLKPILRTPHVQFVDLQYTDCSAEITAFESDSGVRVHSWDLVRSDYDETAALVSALDLVISVCTAVIHLGGALGRPVWVMVPYGCEWRYGAGGEDMPWYPSVRLLRQHRIGDWDTLIGTVADSLRETVKIRVS